MNHSVEFVHRYTILHPDSQQLDVIIDATTNHIERVWKEFKRMCKAHYSALLEIEGEWHFDDAQIKGYNKIIYYDLF